MKEKEVQMWSKIHYHYMTEESEGEFEDMKFFNICFCGDHIVSTFRHSFVFTFIVTFSSCRFEQISSLSL